MTTVFEQFYFKRVLLQLNTDNVKTIAMLFAFLSRHESFHAANSNTLNMNFKFIYTLPLFLIVGFFLAFSNGPAGGDGGNGPRMQDRSGSPFAITQGPTCAACHNNGSFNPGLTIDVLEDGSPIDEYVPGQTYTIRYTIEANAGSPSKFGVQSVILTDNDDSNAGTFGDAPSGTRVATIDTRKYFEHATGSAENTFEIEWTAPEDEAGDVTIFAAGVAANGNGTNGGDNGTAATLALAQSLNVSTFAGPELLPIKVNTFPNPVADRLNLRLDSQVAGFYDFEVLNLQGKRIWRTREQIMRGENNISAYVSDFPSGIYLVKISDGDNIFTDKFIKE
jgi:hypothetical protein